MFTIQRNILDARRWVSLFLVCCFVLCGLGGIHQRAQAIVGVDDALIGILIAGLAAIGITFVSTGAYNSLTEYVGTLLDQYAGSIGTTGQGLFSGVQTGANTTGQLLINNRFVRLISAFGAWLRATFSLADNSDKVLQSPDNVDGVMITPVPYDYRINTGIVWDWYYTASSSPVYLVFYKYTTPLGVYVNVLAYSEAPFVLHLDRVQIRNGEHTYTDYTGELNVDYYFATGRSSAYSDWTRSEADAPVDKVYEYDENENRTIAHLKEVLDGATVDGNEIAVTTGTVSLPLDSPDYEDGDGAVIDVAAPWGMTYPDIVNKWLPKEWAPGQTGNPSMTYDAAPAIDQQVQTGPETAQVTTDPGDYSVPGLQSVFPFCIPFDIYNLLSALAADPVAPSFTWRFYVPRVCDETFTVDLSPFDTVAQIVRTVELLAFIVGLAMVTRERFIRG